MDLQHVRRVAVAAAYEGGSRIRSHMGRLERIDKKGAIDLVTVADLESEQAVIQTIRSAFPDHAVLAEESGNRSGNPDCRWIIDPLDGTTNFAHQIPLFAVSIAFFEKNVPSVGVVFNPVSGELFEGVKGEGALLNGAPIHVSDTGDVGDALLVTGFPYDFKTMFEPLMARFHACMKAARGVRRLGAAALDLCFLACGRFDAFWEQNLKPWDTAAGIIVAAEAGAKITDFSDAPFDVDKKELLATNGRIHNTMLSLMETKGL